MQDYELMLKAYSQAEGSPDIFKDSKTAHLVVHKNKVMGSRLVPGLILEPVETPQGVNIKIVVQKGVKIEYPMHLCFGVLPKEGVQEININTVVEDGAGVKLIAHCVFPNAVKVMHKMNAQILIGDNAYYEYSETHFHGDTGGIQVIPKANIKVGRNSRLATSFSLLKGRVGVFDLDYNTEIGENSVLEMTAKIHGFADDKIRLKEGGRLIGRGAKGLIKSRIAVKDNAESEVINELIAEGPDSRGHVDCIEIIQGNARARAVPIVAVNNESAQVTHEAAIGRVDKKQVETLMSRGLEEDAAIDVVVSGMLR